MQAKGVFILLFSFISVLGSAQNLEIQRLNNTGAMPSVIPLDTLDYAIIRCEYSQSVAQDVQQPTRKTKDRMLLQIGNKISKFYNYTRFISDSIMRNQILSDASMASILAGGRGKRGNICYEIFKGYPEKKNTYVEAIFIDYFYYEENIEAPDWRLLSDTMTVLGYICKKAVCTFCCRDYEAWYAPKIPLREGPWKFTGLPGLILKVSDTKNEIKFEAVAIESAKWKDPIVFKLEPTLQKTDKKKFKKAYSDYMKNPASVIKEYATIDELQIKSKPHNPLELCE
ncbi:MAG: GLPGLI family protein [Candidatus Symbiothrix sp.]|jgi:GLPGLI family protein|nr:GLPGLI family protein [Candidatus Symbiothrix sp.]